MRQRREIADLLSVVAALALSKRTPPPRRTAAQRRGYNPWETAASYRIGYYLRQLSVQIVTAELSALEPARRSDASSR
jgi:hypothetical protein